VFVKRNDEVKCLLLVHLVVGPLQKDLHKRIGMQLHVLHKLLAVVFEDRKGDGNINSLNKLKKKLHN